MSGGGIIKSNLLMYSTRSKSLHKDRTDEYDRKKEKAKWQRRMIKWFKKQK